MLQQAVEEVQPGAASRAALAARRAMAAMAGPQLPDAIVGTAAAIVLDRALGVYRQRLQTQVVHVRLCGCELSFCILLNV